MSFLSGFDALGRHCHTTCVGKSHDGEIETAAVLWIDRERRYFVSTASSTNLGINCRRVRWKQTESGVCRSEIEFTTSKVVQLYYLICSKIDQHNHCRQEDLDIEKKIKTKSWSFSVNSMLLSMVIVDSWLIYREFHGNKTHYSQNDFYEDLAIELIDLDLCPTSSLSTSPTEVQIDQPILISILGRQKTSTRFSTNFMKQMRYKICMEKP